MDVGSIRQCCAYNIQSACENKTGTTEWVILISSFPILILAHARRARIVSRASQPYFSAYAHTLKNTAGSRD